MTDETIRADRPVVAHRKGFYFEIKAGQRYWWCRCGRSKTQPFCDGSHSGTGFKPVCVTAEKDDEVIFCGCKQTGTPPFCDGSHTNLPGGYLTDDPGSAENQAVCIVEPGTDPVVRLDGDCFVFATARAKLLRRGAMSYCPIVSPALGAAFQAQFYIEVAGGSSPVISADGRDTVLFIYQGTGDVEISGQRVTVESRTGIYLRPKDAYRIHNAAAHPLKIFITNGPGSEELVFVDEMPNASAEDPRQRVATTDVSQRQRLAERYYQMLVHRKHGSTVITQFIGNIPLSKAEPHRHLYEETLIFLHGSGVVWTEKKKTRVGPGDVLFLPRKQLHSVQCNSAGGLDIVGAIYPGDNPAINY